VGLSLLACPMFALVLMFVYSPLNTQTTARFVLVGFLAVAAYSGYTWLLILDLQKGPRPSRWATARAVWRWAVFRIRGEELGPVPGVTIALAAFDWLLPRRLSVQHLVLADGIDIEIDPNIRFALAAVRRVRFAPDPAEDYVDSEGPVHYCQAAVELNTGKELCLIVEEGDAGRLRQWAVGKGITVCDCDGYRPVTFEPASEAHADERPVGTG
jgi:hypothetical protein